MLKGVIYSQKIQQKEKDLQNQPQTIKKMAIGTYILIITLKVNGFNVPTKRTYIASKHKRKEKTSKTNPK